MKILVTGGCGFLGSNLAAEGCLRGHSVVVFDNLSRSGSVANLAWLESAGTLEFVYGDIRNANDVTQVVQSVSPDVIFHLAGQVAMTVSIQNPRYDFEVNVVGTYNLLEAVRQYTPEAMVFYSSTNKVYGDLESYQYKECDLRYQCIDFPTGFSESTPLDFRTPYGCSKGAADQYMLDYARVFGLKTVVFRHSSMYGSRQFSTYDQGWVGWFCHRALEIKKGINPQSLSILGNGKQVRDLLYSEDMMNLYFRAIEVIDQIKGQAFNVGGGFENSLSLLELFKVLEEKLTMRIRVSSFPPRESDQRVFVADITKARSLLNWRPRVSAYDGIDKMLSWVTQIVG